jgi:hypothetical protein
MRERLSDGDEVLYQIKSGGTVSRILTRFVEFRSRPARLTISPTWREHVMRAELSCGKRIQELLARGM